MLFSVVVPVYNVKDYISECLDSIIPQVIECRQGAEIILVDDGSTDGSGEICDNYRHQYQGLIKIIHQENQGLLLARRAGFKKAEGEYIVNCDSDDKLAENYFRELSNIINQNGADVIFYNVKMFGAEEEKEWSKDIFSTELCSAVQFSQVIENFFLSYKSVSMCCKAFKKVCIDVNFDYSKYKGLSMGEDTLQSAEIYSRAKSFVYLNKPLYFYRGGSGMTSKFKDDYYFQFKTVCKVIENTKKITAIEHFEEMMAVKVFGIVGRSIMQGRKDRKYDFHRERAYLEKIRKDNLVKKYERFYKGVRKGLKWSYRILCGMLLKDMYLEIWVLLKMINVFF